MPFQGSYLPVSSCAELPLLEARSTPIDYRIRPQRVRLINFPRD